MRKINKIIIHHSASLMKTTTFEDVKRWHLERGFSDIGYHWVIDRNGELWKGRPESKIGAHCKGHNRDSIGICVIGNFEIEEPTIAQRYTLKYIIYYLDSRYKVPSDFKHSELAKTKCPGRSLLHWVELLKNWI